MCSYLQLKVLLSLLWFRILAYHLRVVLILNVDNKETVRHAVAFKVTLEVHPTADLSAFRTANVPTIKLVSINTAMIHVLDLVVQMQNVGLFLIHLIVSVLQVSLEILLRTVI